MKIDKEIAKFLVEQSASLGEALEKINSNRMRVVFIVSADGILEGSLSDGDVRRWMTSEKKLELDTPVTKLMNRNVLWQYQSAKTSIKPDVRRGKEVVPLVDSIKRVVAIASGDQSSITLGGRHISKDSAAFIIAEVGNNHNGDLTLAKKLIRLAVDSGADCVKFQMRDMDALYGRQEIQQGSSDLGAEYTLDLLSKFQLSNDELFEAFDYCKLLGVPPLCTPWDESSLNALEKYGMEFYKVASADFTNHPLLEALSATGKPLICSTGMSTEAEINETVEFLNNKGAQFLLLHCNSTYPSPYKDINLRYLSRLSELSGGLVGYSGHERGFHIPVAAVAMGSKVIEKHFTQDKSMEGNDHKISLLPDEFREMVLQIRTTEEALGQSEYRSLSQGELLNRETLAISVVASEALNIGDTITRDVLDIRSPGQGLQPMYIDRLIGRKLTRQIKAGECFYWSDLEDKPVSPRPYKFERPFGIPVRYHDYDDLVKKSNFDFVEFHLSYQDLKIDSTKVFSKKQIIDFAVHAPELFEGDHLLDLTSPDNDYANRSILEINRVCEATRKLKIYFPSTSCPLIVLNVGGFNTSGFLTRAQKEIKYKRLAENINRIDSGGVELIIQTMPPFPWHFGGQSYHNLFVDPNETATFCAENRIRICLDVSHTMMACNYYGYDLMEAIRVLGPHIAHMHVVDAKGSDGEGIQIGEGDVNFEELGRALECYAPKKMFLPEIWQGHKNGGEGFWRALEFLEKKWSC